MPSGPGRRKSKELRGTQGLYPGLVSVAGMGEKEGIPGLEYSAEGLYPPAGHYITKKAELWSLEQGN